MALKKNVINIISISKGIMSLISIYHWNDFINNIKGTIILKYISMH